MEDALRIGELAAELGLNARTIRYYEAIGLLPAPQRTAAGYRLYGAADRERLRFIGKAKAIGLTLGEIGEILALRREGQQPCEHVLSLLDRKLEAVERQLRVLADFRQELVALREEAAETMAADACVCGIIERHEPARGDGLVQEGATLNRPPLTMGDAETRGQRDAGTRRGGSVSPGLRVSTRGTRAGGADE